MNHVILIVDDDLDVLAVVEQLLEEEHYTVITATSGKAALEAMRRCKPDLILLDHMLPDMIAIDFLDALDRTGLRGHAKVVLFSAVAGIERLVRMLPVDDVIKKPFDLDDLLATVARLLEPTGKYEAVVV